MSQVTTAASKQGVGLISGASTGIGATYAARLSLSRSAQRYLA